MIDAETMMIPDRFSMGRINGLVFSVIFLPFMVMAISTARGRILSVIDALIGLLVGSSFMYWIGAAAKKPWAKKLWARVMSN